VEKKFCARSEGTTEQFSTVKNSEEEVPTFL